MKQHITPEQLNELSNEHRQQLRDWWKPQAGDIGMLEGHLKVFQEGEEFYFPGTHVKYYPLLTIGQMIEFLDEHYRPAEITLRLHTGSESDGHRRRYDIFVEGPGEIEEDHLELCDALWAAVREILER